MTKNKTKSELQAELRQAQARAADLESLVKDREEDDRFASVFRASPFQMAFTELDTGKYVDVNEAFLNSLGFLREEVIGRTALELNFFVDTAQRGRLLKRMGEQGFLRNEHVEVRHRSGEILHGIFTAEYVNVRGQKLLLTIMNDVTEKMRAEERWQFALEGAGDGVWDWDPQTNKVFFSRRWKSMLGYQEEEIGDTLDEWSSRVHPDDRAETMKRVNDHLEGKTTAYHSEHRVRCKDGSYKWILDRGKVFEWDSHGKPRRVIGTHKDIAENKTADEKLRESEERFRSLFESSGMTMLIIEPDSGRIVDANPASAKFYGYTRERLTGMNIDQINQLPPEQVAAERQKAKREERNYFVFPHRLANGQIQTVEVYSHPFKFQEKRLLYSIILDITERKQAEENLRRNERLLRLFVEHSPAAIAMFDREMRYIVASKRYLSDYRLGEQDLSGRSHYEIFPEMTPEHKAIHQRCLEGAVDRKDEDLLPRTDGTLDWVRYELRPWYESDGRVGGLIFFSEVITERKQAADYLRESEKKYRELINGMNDTVWVIDFDTKFLDVNNAAVDTLGYSRDELLSMKVSDIDSGLEPGRILNLIEKLGTEKIQVFETRHKKKDGGEVPVEVSSSLVSYMGRTVIMSIARDITDRKRAEKEAILAERRYHALIEYAPDGVVLIDGNGKFKYASPSVERIFGYTQEDMPNCNSVEMTYPEDLPVVLAELQKLIEQPSRIPTLQYRFRHKSGEWRWIESTFSNLIAAPGVEAIIINFRDIHQRKLAEEEFRLAEHRYRAMIENAPDGIALLGTDNKFKYLSPSAQKITGYDQLEIARQDPDAMTHPDDLPMVIGELEKVIRDPLYKPTVQYRFLNKGGEWRWVESTFSNLIAFPGVEAMILNFRDITESRVAAEALHKSQELLKEAQRIARIGHMEWNGRDQALSCSDEIYDIFGLPRGTPVYQDVISRMMTPGERDRLYQLDMLSIQQRADMDYEYSIRTGAGGIRWLHQMGRVTYGENGIPARMLAIVQDITERKQAEHILSESSTRLEMALKGANAGMWDWNVQTGETVFNERWAEIVGYSLSELEPINIKTWADLCHPDDLKKSNDLLQRHFAGETEFYSSEARMKHKSGVWVWVVDQGKVMEWDENGNPIRMFGTHLDITSQKREELFTQAILRLNNLSYETSKMDDLMRATLDEAEILTDSLVGFFHFVDEDQNSINLQAWSTNTLANMCSAEGKGQHYPVDKAGVWADAIRRGEACIYNDYPSLSHLKGLPDGHASIQRLVSLPVKRNNLVVAALGVGNKPGDYTEQDLTILKRLADAVIDIVMRKRAEDALRENEERFRTVADFTYDMEFWIGEDRSLLYISPSCERITGYDRERFLSDASLLQSIVHPEDQPAFERHSAEEFDLPDSCTLDFRIITAQDGLRWINHTCQAVKDEDGKFRGRRVSHRDVTDQRHVFEELRESEARYRQLSAELEERVRQRTAEVRDLYENAPTGYHSIDAHGKFVMVNQTELDWLGYSREEVIGRSPLEFLAEASHEIFRESFQLLVQSGWLKDVEVEFIRNDGSIMPALLSATALRDEAGNFVASRSTVFDITQRKQAEIELKRNVNFTSVLLNAVPTPVFYMDKEGRYLGCNHLFVELLGKDSAEIQGKLPHEIWDAQQAEIYHRMDLELMQSNQRQVYESEITDKAGTLRPVIFVKDVFFDEGGNVAGLVGAFIDITERKRAEETLRRANRELERALRTKDEFLANISHELRTPLNGILGFTEMLLSGEFGALDDRQSKYLASIDTSGRHLLGLINDLLDLAKIEAGKLEIAPEKVVLIDLCQASLLFVRQAALKKGIHIEFENEILDPFIVADQRRLKQILVNLLSNAVKFTPSDGSVTLKVSFDRDKSCVVFSVSDTGIGISPEDLQKLFKPFTQVDSSLTRSHEGTGLGLALVRELVELHGGSITVESKVGTGSVFVVCIPQTQPESLEDEAGREDPVAEGGLESSLKPPTGKVLLAEDMESNIMIVRDYLEAQGFEVLIARNGREAVSLCGQTLPDLILMDIQMPEMDGLEATRLLRLDPRFATVPIIALTALAMTGDRERCLEAGATEYLSKPMNLKTLNEMIRSLLGGKRR